MGEVEKQTELYLQTEFFISVCCQNLLEKLRHLHFPYAPSLMKAKNLIPIAILLLPLFGCEMPIKNTEPWGFGTIPGYNLVAAEADTSNLNAFVRFSGSRFNSPYNGSTKFCVSDARFLNSTRTQSYDPSSVSFNGYSLSKWYNVYTQGNPSSFSNSLGNWVIGGYQGGNGSFSDSLPPLMTITNVKAGDTVSKSSGFTIQYSGYGGGDLQVSAVYDAGLTRFMVDTSEWPFNGSGQTRKFVSDNGSFSFTASDLSGFTTGKIIRVTLLHWAYTTHRTSNNLLVGSLSTVEEQMPLYLAP